MKHLTVLVLLLPASTAALSQNGCEQFKVVSVYDYPAMPEAPGGSYVLMLLTVRQDLDANFAPNYSDLYFVSESGDTITKPFGPNHLLPTSTPDTITYLIELNTELSN